MRQGSALLLLCSVLILLAPGLLQDVLAAGFVIPDFPQSPLQFDSITVNDGLSNDTVQAIVQDREGFLWFGTDNGLNQYNGYDFVIYTHEDRSPDSLQNSHINALLEDAQGGFWVGTDAGLDWFSPDSGSYLHYVADPAITDSLSSNEISVLFQDSRQTLWVGTRDMGLNRLNAQTSQFVRYQHNRFNYHSINGNEITAIAEDSFGQIWIGTNQGLNRYDPELDRFEHFVPEENDSPIYPNDAITSIVADTQGGLWLGTDGNGLVYFQPEHNQITRYRFDNEQRNSIASNVVLSLCLDRANQLWIGLDKGLDTFNPLNGEFSHLHNAPQSSFWVRNAAVRQIYEDHQGMIWIATGFGGVSKFDPMIDRFTLLQAQKNNPQSLSGNDVTGITETADGVLWISTYGEGITLYDRLERSYRFLRHNPIDPTSLASDKIRSLYQSNDGNIWVGTVENGLDRYRPSTGIFTHFTADAADSSSISEDNITAVLEDHNGRIWVGTYSQGLNLALPGDRGFVRYQQQPENPNSLQDNHILSLYEDRQQRIWIGTWNGISVFSPESGLYRHYQSDLNNEFSLSSNMVFAFYQSDAETMWIATNGGGVNRLDLRSNRFYKLPDPDGVLKVAYAIVPAADGTLWFSTQQGIVQYDPFQESLRIYDERDGLQANQFNAGAYYQNQSGEIFFGGSNGLNIFQPKQIYPSSTVPPIALLTVKSGDQVLRRNLSHSDEIVLPSQSNDLSFEFAVLDYSDAEKNEYAFQLVGYDSDWSYSYPGRRYYAQDGIKDLDREWRYVGARRIASYENLPDGKYTFRVRGTNNDLVWTDDTLSVAVVVKPPFWKTAWFPLGGVAILSAMVFVGNVLRSRRIAAMNLELESQVKDRTFEIQQKQEVAEGLRDILAFINSDLSLEEILCHLARHSIHLLNADVCMVMQFEEDIFVTEGRSGFDLDVMRQLDEDPTRYLQAVFSFENEREPKVISNLQKLIRQKIAEEVPEAISWHRWQLSMGVLFHGLMAIPIMVRGGNVAGKLYYFYVDASPLIKKRAELSELGVIFADQAALAIENAILREHAELNAVTAERNRIARDLHDAVTQTLFSASLVAEVLPRIYADDEQNGREMLSELQQMTRGALAEMRTLLIELRPTSFTEMPLCDLMRQLTDSFVSKLDLDLTVSIEGDAILPAAVQTAVFRIAQEALNNIQKHGMAQHVAVNLVYDAESLSLTILDDGCGFDCEKVTGGHLGLKIMQERAHVINAQLQIKSKINQGTRIRLTWQQKG